MVNHQGRFYHNWWFPCNLSHIWTVREIKEKEITYQWIMAHEMTHSVMAIIPKQETEIKERLLIHSQPTAARL
jgi:hypothetical protein